MTIFLEKTIKKVIVEEHCVNIILKNNEQNKINLSKIEKASVKTIQDQEKCLFFHLLAILLPVSLVLLQLVIVEIAVIFSLGLIVLLNLKIFPFKKCKLVLSLKNGDTNTIAFPLAMKPEIVGKVSAIRSRIYYFNLD